MPVDEIQHLQAHAMSHEDLSSYAGQWVAIRDGKVIASDLDAIALRNHPDVAPDDALLPVPDRGPELLLL
jgi:hypothetical protein